MNKLNKNFILNRILLIKDEKVILDADLAMLYGVETRVLKQAVRRNAERFPEDFMFELTEDEIGTLVSQNVIPSKQVFGGAIPFAFTEQGVAMLSGVLKSKQAIAVNIAIMRLFIQLRRMIKSHEQLEEKIKALEKKYDKSFSVVFEALRQLIHQENKPRKPIGFNSKKNDPKDKS